MRGSVVRLVVSAAISSALAVVGPAEAPTAALQPFDGSWNVLVDCAQAADGARAYRWRFVAEVRGGSLRGQFNEPATEASGTLTGLILPNGDATLQMAGNTGRPQYSVGRVSAGTPFHYTVNAHFDSRSGSGKRNELRQCDLSFTKIDAR